MAKSKLWIRKFKKEGDLAYEYNPLQNILDSENKIKDFRIPIDKLGIDLNHPIDIQCQQSYDGTVNLILNDDKNPPRIINSRFTTLENGKYKIITRNQLNQTNLYNESKVDSQTRLFRNVNKIPVIDLKRINYYGQLKAGNYTFYIKYADDDKNETDVVAESGQVSIFKGTITKPRTVSGGLLDEITDKSIDLVIDNVDTSFSRIYVYYTRETGDMNGQLLTKAYKINRAYPIEADQMIISINGFEEEEEIDLNKLNLRYYVVENVKTQTQAQNMLFFGNVEELDINHRLLQNLSYFVQVKFETSEESIGYLDHQYQKQLQDDSSQIEYYNPLNIYYKLGYWPEEIYRLGIVYIFNNDSLSPVYPLRGCDFTRDKYQNTTTNCNYNYNRFPIITKDIVTADDAEFKYFTDNADDLSTGSIYTWEATTENGEITSYKRSDINYLNPNVFLDNSEFLDNTFGVFRTPKNITIVDHGNKRITPMGIRVKLDTELQNMLKENKIKGFFIVRQKRIPITIAQGFSLGVDATSYLPMLYNDNNHTYFLEGFLSDTKTLTTTYSNRIKTLNSANSSGLLCLDACVNPSLQANFDGTEYSLIRTFDCSNFKQLNRYYYNNNYSPVTDSASTTTSLIYVPSDTPLKYMNSLGFSTRAGSAEDVKQFAFLGGRNFSKDNTNLIRGVFCPFLGTGVRLQTNSIYNIRISNYSEIFLEDYFNIRSFDRSSFYAISNRYELNESNNDLEYLLFRGDCFTNTVTFRIQRNFVDSDTPINDIIVDADTWTNSYNGYDTTTEDGWNNINRADINTVPIGSWFTYKCLSNYNLSLRSEDRTNVDEAALMGNYRSFYPLQNMNVFSSGKIEESWKLNAGYSKTLSERINTLLPEVPYVQDIFDTRIMFSNVQVSGDFKNGYRIFQGLSYEDMDRQYGGIVKLLTWGVNLFCVFEHGLAIIPVNEKALISTNTNQSIHMYGAGVLQKQMTLITPDYGSIWPESVIRTPNGIYGVDTYAKKIWRFSERGFELLSDMKVQKFLNDNIILKESDKYSIVALKNVKTHFNNYKGDILFTFYNNDVTWNLCYNERLDKWITRYSWTPLYSANINNIFYSLDREKSKIYSIVYNNISEYDGIKATPNSWPFVENQLTNDMSIQLSLDGYNAKKYTTFKWQLNSISSSYIDENNVEQRVTWDTFKQMQQFCDNIYLEEEPFNGKEHRVLINNISIDQQSVPGLHLLVDALKENEIIKYYYLIFNVTVYPIIDTVNEDGEIIQANGNTITQSVGLIIPYDGLSEIEKTKQDLLIRNGFYVHGRAGIFDEINYNDYDKTNQILPTMWYNKQEPFEIEFVVNNLTGLHKIFNNLVIISNNVEPESFEFEIVGDVYDFNKSGIYSSKTYGIESQDKLSLEYADTNYSQTFKNVDVVYDNTLDQYSLCVKQKAKDMKKYGRMLGNIHYKEDSWYVVIEPIKYRKKIGTKSDNAIIEQMGNVTNSTRIRDKYIKIRIKYSGEKLVILTAIKTLMTLSYA